MIAPLPIDEKERLKVLDDYDILDKEPEQSFDDLVLLASQICETPIASITLIDEKRQWFKSKIGLTADETPRDIAFCAHTILQKDLFVVGDAQADQRFASNPLVTGAPHIRFYAGLPIILGKGHALGTICVIDRVPRILTAQQRKGLEALSRQVIAQLELRQSLKAKMDGEDELLASELSYRRLFEAAKDGILILDVKTGRITDANPFLVALLGFSRLEMIGKTVGQLSPFKDIESNQAMLEQLQKHGYVRYEDLPMETRDGRQIAVEFVSNVYEAGNEKVIQCSIRDVTERKQSEQKLNLLNTCIANLNDIVLITEAEPLNEPGPRIVFVNEAFERLSGYSSAEVLGRSPRFLQGAKTDRHVLAEIRTALDQRKPTRRQIVNYGKNGNQYWLDIDIVPISDPAGKCTHFAAIERDITEQKRAEIVATRLASIVEFSDDAIIGKDLDSTITSWNRGAEKLFGYTASEMVGASIIRLIPADRQDEENHILGKIRAGESVEHFETLRQTKDGRLIDVSVTASPIKDATGKPIGVSKVARDITERRLTEKELYRERDFISAVVDTVGSLVVVLDRQARIVRFNRACEQMTGFSFAEAQGQNLIDLVIMPEERGSTKREFENLCAGQFPNTFENHWLTRNGEPRVIAWSNTALVDAAGAVEYVIATGTDITERKRAEEQIVEQAAFLDKARDAILVRDLEGKILFWNNGAERVYGWPRQDVIGRNIGELLYTSPKKFAEVNGLTITQGEWSGELQHLTKDHREITIEARWTLIRDNEGNPKSVLAINTDITERKKIEAQFMRAQRMESIGTLAGGIAHDLNNILAPIMMSIELLKSDSDNPQTTKILETIEVSAKRGADIVRQVLSFARGLEGQRVEVQPKHLLNDLASIIKDTFPKDIRLQFSVPNDMWTILADPTQVHQILLNLCVNARDAMPNGGDLTVGVENCVLDDQYAAMHIQAKPGRYVIISVTDSGMGMPPEVIDKIFEPFFTTKELNKGTGLGLSTVIAIVKGHDGIVNVYSELGKGTTFKVYLPAIKTASEGRKEQSDAASLPRGNGETILVVDDEASVLTITGQTLQAFGYRILTATDGAHALGVYAENKNQIAVVLTDMMMPVMDGPSMIHALIRMNPAVKIIAASGLDANGGVARASGAGIKYFLTKPYTAGTLLKSVRAILAET